MTPGQRCPKCGGTQFLIIDPVRQKACDADNLAYSASVIALPQKGWASVVCTGTFRAEVCEQCGFTEWYATGLDPHAVSAILADPASGVRRVRS